MQHVPSMTATQAVFLLLSGLLFWISYLAGQVMFKRESEQDLNLVAQELGLQHTPDGHAALLKSLKGYRLVAGNRFFIRIIGKGSKDHWYGVTPGPPTEQNLAQHRFHHNS
jgi:hypothetical protein